MHELIIVGAGPAGLTAGLYAGRFGMHALILEKMSPGGQIILSSRIENYPGFPGGISTQELIAGIKKQVVEAGVNIEDKEVGEIKSYQESGRASFTVKTQDTTYEAKSIIIATGAKPKPLGIEGEHKFRGRGVSYCATCDGPLFKNKEVAVIGGGDRAIEEAIFLSGYASKVSVIHRRNELRASQILEEKAKNNPKINFIFDTVAEEILGRNTVEAVKIKNVKTDSRIQLPAQAVFIFVGIKPSTAFLENLLEIDEQGFIITDEEMKTSCDGIFACGDCRKKSLYQVVTACGEGAVAADSAHKHLLKQ